MPLLNFLPSYAKVYSSRDSVNQVNILTEIKWIQPLQLIKRCNLQLSVF